ncbi:uncharacterized protein SEPMUDRAFT_151572 [Sphaerulina musiva SO2202]|uniref:N-acetyltransferase domain-containing protein n=1 Tax=Sphaerulina musiva (strain SO2202) TaxID=692275 RepID=N1QDP0_SPHMS|nr:uncharacterized protein SEPMUDRAFT_151572 [Sphaerulina musiva SO2202]EMF09615.1 hypothetical protein SEPMUDRAFT_151572 [Sphaerulina musiva SO2202]
MINMASQCNQSFAATAIISHDLAEKRATDHLATDVGLATTTTTPKNMSLAADQVQAAVAAKKPIGKPSGDGVRILTLAEYKEAALSLAEAFKDDHTSQYFTHTPDRAHWTEQQRWELHVKVMEYITYAHLLKGLVVSAGPNYDCVALWMPPGKDIDGYSTLFRSGLWRLHYQLSRVGRTRFFHEFLPLLTTTKLQTLGPRRDADSWYLVYIGTRAASRGKGYARQVIEYVTRQADAERRACYLESSHVVNLVIYGKLGFEKKGEIVLGRGGEEEIGLDVMVREPVGEDGDSGVDVV